MRAFATTQRSRIPVYRGTEDQILAFVNQGYDLGAAGSRAAAGRKMLRRLRSTFAG